MKIQRGFKFRLKLTPEQHNDFWIQADCARFVWNAMLRRQENRRSRANYVESFQTMCLGLTQLKKHFCFLADADSTALQQLVDFCKYKQKWKNGEVLKVPAPFTSQTCSECDHVDKANRPEQAVFHCVACEGAGLPAPAKLEPGSSVMAKRLVFI